MGRIRTVVTVPFVTAIAATLVACGGGSSSKAKKEPAKEKVYTVAEDHLQAVVGDPQGHAAFVANAVAICFSESGQKQYKLGSEPDCSDAEVLAKINAAQADTLQLGDAPGGTTVEANTAENYSVTSRSVEVEGEPVASFTYFVDGNPATTKDGSSSDYHDRCAPEIEKYCVKGRITPYYG